MSKLAEFRKLEEKLSALLRELNMLKNDPSVDKKIAFEEKLRALLVEGSFDQLLMELTTKASTS